MDFSFYEVLIYKYIVKKEKGIKESKEYEKKSGNEIFIDYFNYL